MFHISILHGGMVAKQGDALSDLMARADCWSVLMICLVASAGELLNMISS